MSHGAVVIVKPLGSIKESHHEGGVLVVDNSQRGAYIVRGRTIKTVVLDGFGEGELHPQLNEALRAATLSLTQQGELTFMFTVEGANP